jgi:hypothetical protein
MPERSFEIPCRSSLRRSCGGATVRYHFTGIGLNDGDWFVNVEPLAERRRANNWKSSRTAIRISDKSSSCASGRGPMTVETDRRPSAVRACSLPVNTVHGFEYDRDTDGWVLTIAVPPAIC